MGSIEPGDLWSHERSLRTRGFRSIAGIDEAGRGPLAGPVVAAAVILPEGFDSAGIDDSKRLSAARREALYDGIVRGAAGVGVGVVGPDVIDRINILQATCLAMKAALDDLGVAFDHVLVDGLPVAGFPAPSTALIGGDGRSVSIAAASIVAKVTRDRLMLDLDAAYPQYGFATHKGYCCKAHLDALDRFGPSPCHRRSFAPVFERSGRCLLIEEEPAEALR